MNENILSGGEDLEIRTAAPEMTSSMASNMRSDLRSEMTASDALSLEETETQKLNTEELLLIGAKTIAGIGIGFMVVIFGTTGIGAVMESTILPTILTKVAGGMAGGALGLSKGVTDSRKRADQRRKHRIHFSC